MKIDLRKLREIDDDLLEEMHLHLNGEGQCDADDGTSCFAAERCATGSKRIDLRTYLAQKESSVLVAFHEGRWVGVLIATWARANTPVMVDATRRPEDETAVYIHTVCVRHDARGAGVASQMMRTIERAKRSGGTYVCVLRLIAQHDALVSIYEHMGYEIIDDADETRMFTKMRKPPLDDSSIQLLAE